MMFDEFELLINLRSIPDLFVSKIKTQFFEGIFLLNNEETTMS